MLLHYTFQNEIDRFFIKPLEYTMSLNLFKIQELVIDVL